MSPAEPLRPSDVRIGDRAHLWLGGVLHEVEIIEDRGEVPSTGHRVVRIKLLDTEDSSFDFEVPVGRLLRWAGSPEPPADRPTGRRSRTRHVPA